MTHHATQIIVGVSGLGSAGVLMSVVLSYYLVTLLVRCEVRGGRAWAHIGAVSSGQTSCYHVLIY